MPVFVKLHIFCFIPNHFAFWCRKMWSLTKTSNPYMAASHPGPHVAWDLYVFCHVCLLHVVPPPSVRIHSNFTWTYLGVFGIAEREMTSSDLDLGKSGHFKFKNHILAFFSQFILVIPIKHGKENFVPGYECKWPWTKQWNDVILKVKNCILALFLSKAQAIQQFTTKFGRFIARCRGHIMQKANLKWPDWPICFQP